METAFSLQSQLDLAGSGGPQIKDFRCFCRLGVLVYFEDKCLPTSIEFLLFLCFLWNPIGESWSTEMVNERFFWLSRLPGGFRGGFWVDLDWILEAQGFPRKA